MSYAFGPEASGETLLAEVRYLAAGVGLSALVQNEVACLIKVPHVKAPQNSLQPAVGGARHGQAARATTSFQRLLATTGRVWASPKISLLPLIKFPFQVPSFAPYIITPTISPGLTFTTLNLV